MLKVDVRKQVTRPSTVSDSPPIGLVFPLSANARAACTNSMSGCGEENHQIRLRLHFPGISLQLHLIRSQARSISQRQKPWRARRPWTARTRSFPRAVRGGSWVSSYLRTSKLATYVRSHRASLVLQPFHQGWHTANRVRHVLKADSRLGSA